jgi:hypothetical protein
MSTSHEQMRLIGFHCACPKRNGHISSTARVPCHSVTAARFYEDVGAKSVMDLEAKSMR